MKNNVSELKEALESTANVLAAIADALEKGAGGVPIQEVNKALEDANKALELPLRNCAVGTAEEQYKRFQDFCLHNSFRGVCSVRCPLYTQCTIGSYQTTGRTICFPAWAQMPYEADTDKE